MNRVLTIALLGLALTACRESKVQKIAPTLAVDALTLDFGPVRVDTTKDLTLSISAANGADVQLASVTLEGDAAFTLDAPPTSLRGLTSEMLALHFKPTSAGDVT